MFFKNVLQNYLKITFLLNFKHSVKVSSYFVGDDFNESMKRNQMLASSAIKRAMSDANAGKLLCSPFPWNKARVQLLTGCWKKSRSTL